MTQPVSDPPAVASVCLPACLAEPWSCVGVTTWFSVGLWPQGLPIPLTWLCGVRWSADTSSKSVTCLVQSILCGTWCPACAVAAASWGRWQLQLEPSSEAAESGSTGWVERGWLHPSGQLSPLQTSHLEGVLQGCGRSDTVLPCPLPCKVTSSGRPKQLSRGSQGRGCRFSGCEAVSWGRQSLCEVRSPAREAGCCLVVGRRGSRAFPRCCIAAQSRGAERGGELGRQGMLHCRAEIRSLCKWRCACVKAGVTLNSSAQRTR